MNFIGWQINHETLDGNIKTACTFHNLDTALAEYQKIVRHKSHKNVELFPIK